jgi:hypothetical protein
LSDVFELEIAEIAVEPIPAGRACDVEVGELVSIVVARADPTGRVQEEKLFEVSLRIAPMESKVDPAVSCFHQFEKRPAVALIGTIR